MSGNAKSALVSRLKVCSEAASTSAPRASSVSSAADSTWGLLRSTFSSVRRQSFSSGASIHARISASGCDSSSGVIQAHCAAISA